MTQDTSQSDFFMDDKKRFTFITNHEIAIEIWVCVERMSSGADEFFELFVAHRNRKNSRTIFLMVTSTCTLQILIVVANMCSQN